MFINYSPQEIYPPKISDFAYVTDGACNIDDIQQAELLMLKVRGRASCSVGNGISDRQCQIQYDSLYLRLIYV